ncbi:IFI44-like protein [Mya arenaria]|uniref:IFI44-like protein n=1 Tax=Mya arenaria TaxID=6604 RepID=A0ABY7G5P8_MYAAR|nr:IFI44-like protein [Mya arenaria]
MVGRLTEDQMDILENMIGSSPKSFKLLYSITRDGRSAADFHQRCDNQGPTVTVLYNPRGSIYGGYAGVSWQSSGGYTADDTAFIFQLLFSGKRVVNTFRPKNVSKALYFCHDDSPHFGAQDLKAFSKIVSLNTDGTFNLNGKLAVGTYYHSNNVTNENINNGIMVVTEMEVYAVSDEARKSPPKGTAWRKTPNLNAEYTSKMTEELSLIKPQSGRGITDFRLLLVGPIAAGKSSFINTVMSAFAGRVIHKASVGSSDNGLTNKYMPYPVRQEDGSCLNFRLCDTPGIGEHSAMDVVNLHFLLDGHLPNSFQFSHSHHVSTKTVGIPIVVILTKIDKLHEEIEDNLADIFKCQEIKAVVDQVSETLGIPPNHVFPVKNYHSEMETEVDMHGLALIALRKLICMASDVLEERISGSEDSLAESTAITESDTA